MDNNRLASSNTNNKNNLAVIGVMLLVTQGNFIRNSLWIFIYKLLWYPSLASLRHTIITCGQITRAHAQHTPHFKHKLTPYPHMEPQWNTPIQAEFSRRLNMALCTVSKRRYFITECNLARGAMSVLVPVMEKGWHTSIYKCSAA